MNRQPHRPEAPVVAGVIRDWIHEQPFSQCDMGSDTCPDWPMAYELTDLIMKAMDVRNCAA